ncbi:hypothetical protein [Laspinema palackyanum]|uniref:hypothetical protein n=1 Tax=Laspinema palackyanum TaxID=3231601 RepID=UPI00345CD541|nr:helix-turn-helix transcriptional regulator [Laspinema sp. D2c]
MVEPKKPQGVNNQLIERYRELKLNKTKLSKFVGVRRATIHEWLDNGGVPNLDPARMHRLAVALNCDSIFELVQLFQPSEAVSAHELRKEIEGQK